MNTRLRTWLAAAAAVIAWLLLNAAHDRQHAQHAQHDQAASAASA